jgi:transposase
MPKSRPPYPPEFRIEAVRLVKEGGRTISDVAQSLGVSYETLRKWVHQGEGQAPAGESLSTFEQEELQRLRREVRQLREEREILKKAAAFFAQETNKAR